MAFLPLYIYFIAISFLVSLTVYFKPKMAYSYLRLFPAFFTGNHDGGTLGLVPGVYR